MKDFKSEESGHFVAPQSKNKTASLGKAIFSGSVLLLGSLVVIIFGLGFFAFHCDHQFASGAELLHAEHIVSEAHELVVRGLGSEGGLNYGPVPDVNLAQAAGSSGLTTGTVTSVKPTGVLGTVVGTAPAATAEPSTEETSPVSSAVLSSQSSEQHSYTEDPHAVPIGMSIPISTHTELSTIYTVLRTAESDIYLTKTTTATTTVTRSTSESEAATCPAFTTTQTVSVFVTVSPVHDETVTGEPSTATEVHTDVSYTTGLPDVTLPGKASTQTTVQTDVSLTAGLPDATVSGDPETHTDTKTHVSLTEGLPDATVSGNPSTVTEVVPSSAPIPSTITAFTTVVITDLWSTVQEPTSSEATQTSLKTSIITTKSTALTTITITDLFSPATSSSSYSSALADAATASPSYPAPHGGNSTATTTAPLVLVSEGNKEANLRGWGSMNLVCAVMLAALFIAGI
ncbi:hypothetical protein HIM_01732 [Hirsutella minnesotensis 3608]|nr:hypothetical protein HIM_01732 [Hirsutella minnesotensis 3608]